MASQVGTARKGQAGVDSACHVGRRERARMGESYWTDVARDGACRLVMSRRLGWEWSGMSHGPARKGEDGRG